MCTASVHFHLASNAATELGHVAMLTNKLMQNVVCELRKKLVSLLVYSSIAFMSKCDVQVREQNPELGKDSHIQQVGMDAVYAMADKGNKELSFRFMPDAQQVRHAMQVCHTCCILAAGHMLR